MIADIKQKIAREIKERGIDAINELNEFIFEHSDYKDNPVSLVRWVNLDEVQANDYNPNAVASIELRLLGISISHDGYTQPIVTIYDPEIKKYVIVDGFHRYFVMKSNPKIREKNKGRVPVVVLQKNINDRMASTVRHNRARGKHSVAGMANLVYKMKQNGWGDVQICNELGLEADELLRLSHISGVAKLFEGKDYGKSWEEIYQIKERLKKEEKNESI